MAASSVGFGLSAQQERIWSQQIERGATYWAKCDILLSGTLDHARLKSALDSLVARHEILRIVIPDASGPVLNSSLAASGPDQHVLSLTLPALCADVRTLSNLAAELGRCYAAGAPDTGGVLQYADLLEWQQDLLTGEDTRAGREFWREYRRKLDPASWNFLLSPFEIAPEAAAQPPGAVSAEINAVPAGVLLACWQLFLSRMTGQAAVAIAREFDGRSYEDIESVIGPFARFIPIAAAIDPEIPFRTFLHQVTAAVAEAGNWQESFAWSQLDPAPPLPVAFDYAELPAPQTYGGVRFTVTRQEACPEYFPIRLSARARAGSLTLEFHYDPARFEHDTLERWRDHFITLLTAAVEHPETPVARLPLLTNAQRRQLLVEWNQTAVEFPRGRCFHELFEAQAARTPGRVAVQFEDRQLTYHALNQRANQLAHSLRCQGVGPDRLVGLCLQRGVDMITGLIAVLKAGGAYVPLNPDDPKPRLSGQLEGAAALVTETALLPHLPEFKGPQLTMDGDRELWSNQPQTNPEPAATPENLVYVIFTSGSTGVPKGVGVRHRNLVNYSHFIEHRLNLASYPEGLHFATVSTLSADLGNTSIYPALASGGCVHVISQEMALDSAQFAGYCRQYPLDVLKIVPSHLEALLGTPAGAGVLPGKYLILGGEALTPRLVDTIRELGAECEISNHYGPTETTVESVVLRLSDYEEKRLPVAGIPIGRPVDNTQIYILDACRQPVPVGAVGELYIAGGGVAAGYLNQPELTAERFLANPFLPGSTMYRTGDLCRYLPDGNVDFLGRADDQVKIRGYRVELGEIEAVLAGHAGVKQAIVIAKPDAHGDKRLIAYVVDQRERAVTAGQLREYLKERLPEYMVPGAMVLLPKLPLNANGKLDRHSLPEPEQPSRETQAAASTATEAQIAAIWAEVLGLDHVGADDDFFEIGGHSLLAVQVLSRMNRTLGLDLPLQLLFDSPTIGKLAGWIDQARREGPAAPAPPITRVPREQPLPLSFAQQRLWVIQQLDPGSPLYNIPRTLRMRGSLNAAAFERALNEIVRRHESQRTTFAVHDGQPVQVIAGHMTVPLPIEDLTPVPLDQREAEARRLARHEGIQPFDLVKGPLIRARLLRLAPDDHVFLFTAHHIVSDAWSAGILMEELSTVYEAFTEGRPSPLPEPVIQYADYAAWQRQWLQGDVLRHQLAWWREHLAGAPSVLELPSDRPRSKTPVFDGSSEAVWLPAETTKALKALSRQEDVTLFMTLLAGFQALLSRYSGQEQIVLGTDVANRTSVEAERLIGFFINLLPLRTDLSGDPPFRELLGRVRSVALGAYAHQDMPFDKLVEELQPERSSSHSPIVQVLFVMQNTPSPRRELAGLELVPFEMPVTQSKFDLAVFMVERDDRLVGYWVYRTELFERDTILRMARQFETLLAGAASRPDTRLSALEIFNEEERQRRQVEQKERKQLHHRKLKATEPRTASLPSPLPGDRE